MTNDVEDTSFGRISIADNVARYDPPRPESKVGAKDGVQPVLVEETDQLGKR